MNTNNTKTGVYFYGDESFNFNFATSLSASKKISFINSIVDTVVDNNYYTVIRDILFDFAIIRTFTDIDTTFVKNSDNMIDTIEEFLDETNIVDIVEANMEFGLLEELNEAVDKAIEFRTGIHPSPFNDALASLLSTLEKKVNEIDLGSAMGMAQKFMGMTEDLTPESLINAYINSETHQNNVVEIAKSKKNKKSKNSKKNEIKISEGLGEAIRAVVEENKAENDSENDKK